MILYKVVREGLSEVTLRKSAGRKEGAKRGGWLGRGGVGSVAVAFTLGEAALLENFEQRDSMI